MLTCYHCGKRIEGYAMHHVPSNLAMMLGADFKKAYHPGCYTRAEQLAAQALRKGA